MLNFCYTYAVSQEILWALPWTPLSISASCASYFVNKSIKNSAKPDYCDVRVSEHEEMISLHHLVQHSSLMQSINSFQMFPSNVTIHRIISFWRQQEVVDFLLDLCNAYHTTKGSKVNVCIIVQQFGSTQEQFGSCSAAVQIPKIHSIGYLP